MRMLWKQVVLYEIYMEDGGNGITFVHMLYIKFVETLREDIFKGIKLLKKQNKENKLHTKKY